MPITSAEAQRVCDAGVAKAQETGHRITITVVDAALEIRAVRRMDGSRGYNFDLSYRMAYTAGLIKRRYRDMDTFPSRGWFPALCGGTRR